MAKILSWILVMAKIFVLDFRHGEKSCQVFVTMKIQDENYAWRKLMTKIFVITKIFCHHENWWQNFFVVTRSCAHVWKITWTLSLTHLDFNGKDIYRCASQNTFICGTSNLFPVWVSTNPLKVELCFCSLTWVSLVAKKPEKAEKQQQPPKIPLIF